MGLLSGVRGVQCVNCSDFRFGDIVTAAVLCAILMIALWYNRRKNKRG